MGRSVGEARVGTAGWSIPKPHAPDFPSNGAHLERYAQRLNAVEINSSFYRPHRPVTYERWARSVPDDFRFAVKLPREITHIRRLAGAAQPLTRFLAEVSGLGGKLGPVLVQLPPSLRFEEDIASTFFGGLRRRFAGRVVCEPRHPTWFTDAGDAALRRFEVARVAVDPACVPRAAEPGGWPGLAYHRLHGFPRMYYSAYPAEYLAALACAINAGSRRVEAAWCIFDNTALGAATANALDLSRRLASPERVP